MLRLFLLKSVVPELALLIVGLILLSACNTTAPTPGGKASLSVPSIGVANAVLKPISVNDAFNASNTAVNGIAQLELIDHTLTVTVSMIGLLPKTSYQTAIFDGTCEARGKMTYQLEALTVGGHGIGSSKTIVKNVSSLPDQRWSVEVQIPQQKTAYAETQIIACGQVLLSH